MLRKKPFSVSKYSKDICVHIEKGSLAASYHKPLFLISMETNVAAWRFLMSSLVKNEDVVGSMLYISTKNINDLNKIHILLLVESLSLLVVSY